MANQPELKVAERDNTLNPRQLRKAGYIPTTLYGKGIHSVQIQVKAHEFNQLLAHGNQTFKLNGFVNVTAKTQKLQFTPVGHEVIGAELLLLDGAVPHAALTSGSTAKTTGKTAKSPKSKKEAALTK